jgi:hypothetical protein
MVNKKILAVFVLFLIMVSRQAKADQISFIWDPAVPETLQGVDSPAPTGWSNSDSIANLGTNQWSLLNGAASVNAYDGKNNGILTHRGTRGLGIAGHENDEIDSYHRVERLVITFDQPQYLNSFEVRSLFYEPNLLTNGDHKERGVADFYLGDTNIYTQLMIGSEDIRTAGTKGIAPYIYEQPYLVDKLVFHVPKCEWYTWQSEFAVAKLNVTAVPEPVSTVLFITGGAALAVRRLRKKIIKGEGR